jgi:xanthine dehydrogenase accessory factor
MNPVLEALHRSISDGERVALATVVSTKRSAPQPPGTKMVVNERGDVVGAVSGGCVEGAVVVVAEGILAGDEAQLLHYGVADEDAWDVGLPCGGEIGVWVEACDGAGLQSRFTELALSGNRAALVTVVQGEGPRLGEKLLVHADGTVEGTLGVRSFDDAATAIALEAVWTERSELHEVSGAGLFVDVAAPAPRLIIFGAVDFAAQLAAVAALSGWRAYVVDPRARFATPERFPAAEQVLAVWPQDAFAQLAPIDRATAIAVLTHDPKLDDAALTGALASEAGYIGAMGSRRAQAKRRERLLAAGVDEAQLERISAPIGLDLGALTSAETALSIMGEIVATRNGRTGGRLIDASGRIHDAVPV